MEPGTSMGSDHFTLCEISSRNLQGYRNVLIAEDAARDAVQKYTSSSYCCYRPRAEEPVIERLTQMPLYRYKLETFTETRHIERTCKPHTDAGDASARISVGQRIDASYNKTLSQLWEIEVYTPKMFHEGSKKFPLPGSREIKSCHKCGGRGRCKCSRCGGSGQFRCRCSSSSRQRSRNKRCPACSGSGRKRCSKCSGRGRRICVSCNGEGRLLYYQQLAVKWKTLRSEIVSDPPEQAPSLPLILLQKVTGEVIMTDEDVRVRPVPGFADVPDVSAASARLIQDHQDSCGPSCRVLRQRQTLEMIPVAYVQYGSGGKNLSCHVYGRERRVYAKRRFHDLPCGCSVM
ncbi:protein SSUH2 homolog [Bufo gargarizans]|uniref:protein SSUH2 homolog n=1 Tax=Bufo gargarizans TaxID=30331 RepID=UPI001CF19954|nr:protein SSUH2 homolog [Bufo gargarizans]